MNKDSENQSLTTRNHVPATPVAAGLSPVTPTPTPLVPAPIDWRSRVRYFIGPIPLADAIFAVFFLFCAGISFLSVVDYGPSFTYVTNVFIELTIAIAAVFRRQAVVRSFVMTYLALAALAALAWWTPVNLGLSPIVFAAPTSLWAVTRWASHRSWGFIGLFLGLVGSFLNPAIAAFEFTTGRLIALGLPAVLITAAAYAIPAWLRTTAEQHEADLTAAITRSRLELSRELHDVVGHGLTAIKVQAQTALYLNDASPDRAALEGIQQTAEQSLADVHALVDALRDGGEITADPTQIPRLIHATLPDSRGIAINLPDSYEAIEAWPLARRLALVRAVAEVSANMAKHSTGAGHISMKIKDTDPAQVSLTSVNDTTNSATTSAKAGDAQKEQKERTGAGLVGLSERVAELGGTMTYGEADGQFRVEVSL